MQLSKPCLHVLAQVNSQEPALGQRLEILARLGRFDRTKRIFLSRYYQIVCVLASDLQEHPEFAVR